MKKNMPLQLNLKSRAKTKLPPKKGPWSKPPRQPAAQKPPLKNTLNP
jgi:hypothetical protein